MRYFVSAIFAGIMIAFGGIVFLCCANLEFGKIIGAFLFSLGLLTVIARGFDLYTGKVGYLTYSPKSEDPNANQPTNIAKNLAYFPIIVLGNFVGTLIVAMAFRATRSFANLPVGFIGEGTAVKLLQLMLAAKTNDSLLSIFLLSCACGIMMFLAVDGYKKTKSWLFVILPVMVFILCGFEHCVANMFYFCASGNFDLKSLEYLLIMILGNGVGAVAFRYFSTYRQ